MAKDSRYLYTEQVRLANIQTALNSLATLVGQHAVKARAVRSDYTEEGFQRRISATGKPLQEQLDALRAVVQELPNAYEREITTALDQFPTAASADERMADELALSRILSRGTPTAVDVMMFVEKTPRSSLRTLYVEEMKQRGIVGDQELDSALRGASEEYAAAVTGRQAVAGVVQTWMFNLEEIEKQLRNPYAPGPYAMLPYTGALNADSWVNLPKTLVNAARLKTGITGPIPEFSDMVGHPFAPTAEETAAHTKLIAGE